MCPSIRRRQCEKRWRRPRSFQDFEVHKKARNEVNKILFKSKVEYYKFKLSSTTDQNEVFKLARQLLNTEKPSVLPVHDSHSELAESFCEYFVSKIQRSRDGFSSARNSGTIDYASCCQGLVLSSFSQADDDEISKLVKQMKNKSCQLDPLPTWLVKQCLPALTPVLCQMIHLSFRLCEVSDDMKLAMVTPLLKKNDMDPECLKNFRPVSNLTFTSKLLEKVVAARLSCHLDENNVREPYQSTYLVNHSTETALLEVHDDVCRFVDTHGAAFLGSVRSI